MVAFLIGEMVGSVGDEEAEAGFLIGEMIGFPELLEEEEVAVGEIPLTHINLHVETCIVIL